MNIKAGQELEDETYERVDKRNRLVEKKIMFIKTDLIKKYPYKTMKIKKLHIPEDFGYNENYFGGNAYRCASLKDSPYVLIVNKFFETLALHVPKENLSKFTVNELYEMANNLKLKPNKTMKKDELVTLLTNY